MLLAIWLHLAVAAPPTAPEPVHAASPGDDLPETFRLASREEPRAHAPGGTERALWVFFLVALIALAVASTTGRSAND